MAYNNGASRVVDTEQMQQYVQYSFRKIFQRIVPPDVRSWQWDCYRIDVLKSMPNFATEIRIAFTPGRGVFPTEQLTIHFVVDDHTMEAIMDNQLDLVHLGKIEDFVIKCMMVYSFDGNSMGA